MAADRAGAGTLRTGLAGETRRAAGGPSSILRHPHPGTGGIRRLGNHPECLHRGRQPGSPQAAPEVLLWESEDDLADQNQVSQFVIITTYPNHPTLP